MRKIQFRSFFKKLYYYRVAYKNLKTIRCFSWNEVTLNKRAKQVSHSAGGSLVVESQPLQNFANLNLLKAWMLPFWYLKKTNLKGCDSEH